MTLKIKKYPDPILRKKSQEVKMITPEIKKLIENMIETMEKNQGFGLSASQVGVLKRVIVAETERGPLDLINPKIIKNSKEKILDEEGCLSFPGLFLKIKRWKEVEIKAFNNKGEKIQIKTEDLPARILQHEIDHLDGILFIDRIGFWQKWKIRNKLKELKKSYGPY